MVKIYDNNNDTWVRPWNKKSFDDLYYRDERFFSIVIKGALSWLTRNIVMYDEPIRHFIFNTGSSYMYIESNGYEFSWNETTGEDQMYMKMPRCVCEFNQVSIPTEELSQAYSRGIYERQTNNGDIIGFNAEMRRIPIEMTLHCRYVLSNFNESLILVQEMIDKLLFQQYYQITYLGQKIQCSIQFPDSQSIEINKIDMASAEINQKVIELDLIIHSNYPKINERTEIPNSKYISSSRYDANIHTDLDKRSTDTETIIVND